MSESTGKLLLEFTRKERHDLYNPLNQIIGYVELLREEAEEAGHKEMLPTLDKVHAAAQALNRMLSELLARAKETPGPEAASKAAP